jgi:hypothetical protein
MVEREDIQMTPENSYVDLQQLTVKEHLIMLNEKIREIKEDTEELKGNDKCKWAAIRENKNKVDSLATTVKIYVFITGVILTAGVGVVCKTLFF